MVIPGDDSIKVFVMFPFVRAFQRVIIAVALSFVCVGAAFAGELVQVTLLQLNDVYQLTPVDKGKRGGFARVATLVKQIEEKNPHVVMVLGGDTLSPSVASKIFQGKHMIEGWNALGLDYAVLGNHEFDFGPEVLKQRMGESKFTWLGANVLESGKPLGKMPPYVIREFDGVKVGFIGLLTPDTTELSDTGPNVTIQDPVKTASRLVRTMKAQGVHVIVALTHLSMPEDKKLAKKVPVDLILGGHEHTLLHSHAGKTPILKMGSDARNLGKIVLNIDSDSQKLESIDWEVIPVTDVVADDPTMAAMVAKFEETLNTELGQSIGETKVELNALQVDNRSRETNLGNLVADAYRAGTDADVALVNGGSIRSNSTYGPGPLTRRDVLSILPFENPVVTVALKGKVLKAALENGVSRLEGEEAGRFPHVSGMKFTYDPNQPVGSRIQEVWIGKKPLEDERTYILSTSAYLLDGGDGYSVFKGQVETLINPQEAPKEADLVITAIQKAKTIAPKEEGRSRPSVR